MTEISAAATENEPASETSVMHVAIARWQSAKCVADRRRLIEARQNIDLTWLMGMPLGVLHSFHSRILALVLGLVTLVLTAAICAIAVQARAEVERQVGIQLHTAADTAREVLRFRGTRLAIAVEVLTADFGFKEAVASADAPTLLSAVENQRARINADLVIVLNPDGYPVSSTLGTLSAKTQNDLQHLIANDTDGEILQLYRLIDGRPYQLVLAPVRAPVPIGWAAMGFALDDRVATEMSRLLGVDVSFVAGDEREPAYVATSVDRQKGPAFAGIMGAPEAMPFVVTAGSDKILTWTNPIHSANGRLTLVLQRSLASALRPYNDVRNSMIAIGALLLAIASAFAVLLARSATKPVEDLTKAAERLEAGDYSVEVPPASTTELKGLASAFNAMRAAVADREATIRHQANHDASTGLPTRSRITEILDGLLIQAQIAGQGVTVCLVEIQQFQSITGSFGHAAGDEVLSEVARRLVAQSQPDHVGHIGTDRFLVLIESVGHAEAARQAEIIVGRLRGSFDYADVSFQLEVRVGVAVFPTDGAQAAALLQRADLALYRAKETGITVGVYRDGDDSSHRHRLAILGELRRAITADELELHYQPKVDASSGQLVGCEALVRWRHPQKGFIPPSEFIPHAERTGAIRSLTAWVVATALRDLKCWQAAGFGIDVAINVSPVDLADPGFADQIAMLLAQIGVDASHVVLEVTESGAMKDLPATMRMMEQLRVLGIRFSIDDFGTGYSSLAHLKRLPVDEVKIDRSFIQELETRRDDDVIVRSTINLGHAMHLKVVAEGVEMASSWEALGRLGCDLIQGYYVSKPLPLSEFTAWMVARTASHGCTDTNVAPARALATRR
jgi:diguanylate cyclase (GGDEF)-like protein